MYNEIENIDPLDYLKKHSPRTEPTPDVSQWFLDETIEIEFGEDIGRPNERILLQREYLTRFLENGWTIDAVLSKSWGGSWEKTSSGTTKDFEHTEKLRREINSSLRTTETTLVSSEGEKSSNESGDPFWNVSNLVRLKRRRLQPELVMKSMINSFISEYNSGRSIDSSRFNELMSLYSVVLKQNEKEGTDLIRSFIDGISPRRFLDQMHGKVWGTLNSARNSISYSAITEPAIDEINRNYDALVSKAKAQMISNGTYNGTVWPSVLSGIERDRAAALAKARAEASSTVSTALVNVGTAQSNAEKTTFSALLELQTLMDNRKVTAINNRNSVVKWMMDFVGNRKEIYPELEEILGVTKSLGFSVGSAGNVL